MAVFHDGNCNFFSILWMTYFFVQGPGNVSDHVIIERQSESTVTFCEGAKDAYLGYVTLKVS